MYKKPQKHHYETSRQAGIVSALVAAIAFFVIMSYYVFNGRPVNLAFTNRALAIGSVFLIGASYILGPLSRLAPKIIIPKLQYRKPLGLYGYLFAVSHILLSLVISGEELASNGLSIFFGMIAIIIFTMVASTSMVKSISAFGFNRWQKIQRTGYVAFLLVIVHFTVLESGQFIARQLGQITLIFALFVVLARLAVFVVWKK